MSPVIKYTISYTLDKVPKCNDHGFKQDCHHLLKGKYGLDKAYCIVLNIASCIVLKWYDSFFNNFAPSQRTPKYKWCTTFC